MKIKKGDTVIVISGKDRNKSGTVLTVFPKKDRVLVEGVNVAKKHQKPRRAGSRGQIVDRPMPLHISNVAVKDPKSGKPSRVGYTKTDGKKVRIARKSGAAL